MHSSAPSVYEEAPTEPLLKPTSSKGFCCIGIKIFYFSLQLLSFIESECVLMSLTHDHLTAFGLQFDDVSWKRHIPSLKPLGLNILLNTCNPATQNHYTKFCSHITCEAMYNEDLVPVSQRRYPKFTCSHQCDLKTIIFDSNNRVHYSNGFNSKLIQYDLFVIKLYFLCFFSCFP